MEFESEAAFNGAVIAEVAKRRPRSVSRATPPRFPFASEIELRRELRRLMAQGRRVIKETMAEALAELRTDQEDEDPQDSTLGVAAVAAGAIAVVRSRLATIFEGGLLGETVSRWAFGVRERTLRAQSAHLRRVLGEDFLLQPDDRDLLALAIRDNVKLIQGLERDLVRRTEQALLIGLRRGQSVSDISSAIQRQTGIVARRADLIARDQTASLNGEITRLAQINSGITRYRWVTQGDERVRPSHEENDGKVFSWDNPPATGHPGTEINCLPPGANIVEAHGIIRVFRSVGAARELAFIVADDGSRLEATPNHQVLTGRGWVAAKEVDVGDDVLKVGHKRTQTRVSDYHEPVRICDIFHAAKVAFEPVLVKPSAEHFHGDGLIDDEVHVVDVTGDLSIDPESPLFKSVHQLLLAHPYKTGPGLGAFYQCFFGVLDPSSSLLRRGCYLLSVLGARSSHADMHRFAAISNLHAAPVQHALNRLARDAVALGQGKDTHPTGVELRRLIARVILRVCRGLVPERGVDAPGDELVAERFAVNADGLGGLYDAHALSVERLRVVDKGFVDRGCAHVFNLETKTNYYHSTLTVHNCRCTAQPVLS